LFAGHQFRQCFGREPNASDPPQQSCIHFMDADQHGLKGRGFTDAVGNGAQQLVERLLEIQTIADLGDPGQRIGAAAQQLGTLALFLVALDIAQRDGCMRGQGLDNLQGGLIEEIGLGGMQVDQARRFP
jgi:hypothetical protein